MDAISRNVLLLAIWWVAFFWNHFGDRQQTGELVSNHFPHWKWLGKKFRIKDGIYYLYPGALPFLSTFYPPHFLSAKTQSFKVLNVVCLLHYFFGSVLSFFLFMKWFSPEVALFGSLTVTYMASSIKLHNPCIMYTLAWLPGCLMGGWFGAFSFGMAILGGYWPTLIYFLPFICFLSPISLVGCVIGLPQIYHFARYYKDSIRYKSKCDKRIGSVPWWRYLNLLGFEWHFPVRGLLYLESEMYLGLIPLFFMGWHGLVTIGVYIIVTSGMVSPPFRHSCRLLHTMGWAVTFFACQGLTGNIGLLIAIQAYCLWRNRDLYPMHPFSEHPVDIKTAFDNPLTRYLQRHSGELVSGLPFPLSTGYTHEFKTCGYTGGMMLKKMAKLRNVTNPNGESAHDWFRLREDAPRSTIFCFRPLDDTSKKGWRKTPVKGLFKHVGHGSINVNNVHEHARANNNS